MEENKKIEKISDETLEDVTGGHSSYENHNVYYVQYGDTYLGISRKLGFNLRELAILNNLTPNSVPYIGQEILYPKGKKR